jgi:putative heme-binding domain-containing protein
MRLTFTCRSALTGFILLACGTAAASAGQHEVGAIEQGQKLFFANCATCHGAEGDAIFGVDLAHNEFRHATTDADLIRIIRTGIQGTDMPPSNFSFEQAAIIVAYLRSLASTPPESVPGDVASGRSIFQGKGGCVACHRVGDTGSRTGPDLSDIGHLRRAEELKRSLEDPGAEIQPANRTYRVVTRDGTTVTGRLLNHDTYTVQLMDSKQQLRSFATTALREYGLVDASPMPSYRYKLTASEMVDLVKYLVSLRPPSKVTP